MSKKHIFQSTFLTTHLLLPVSTIFIWLLLILLGMTIDFHGSMERKKKSISKNTGYIISFLFIIVIR